MKYTPKAFMITALTNMHVGAGGANYGVVDNLVQRDPVTDMPVIHASSLKGALREFFDNYLNKGPDFIDHVFGPDLTRGAKDPGIGKYKFFQADLLALPVRSNNAPYYLATAPCLIDNINEKARSLGLDEKFIKGNYDFDADIVTQHGNTILEDYQAQRAPQWDIWEKFGNEPVAVYKNHKFKQRGKELPVIARNKLENGQSVNLWYEEIVPRKSKFIFFVNIPDNDPYMADFIKEMTSHTVQIGANATIGYGYVNIEKI